MFKFSMISVLESSPTSRAADSLRRCVISVMKVETIENGCLGTVSISEKRRVRLRGVPLSLTEIGVTGAVLFLGVDSGSGVVLSPFESVNSEPRISLGVKSLRLFGKVS